MFHRYIQSKLGIDISNMAFRQAYLVLAILSLLAGVLIFYIAFNLLVAHLYVLAAIEAFCLVVVALAWYLIAFKKKIDAAAWIIVGVIFALTLYFIFDQKHNDYALAQAVMLPVVAIYLLGMKKGMQTSILYVGLILAIAFTGIDTWEPVPFTVASFTNLFFTYLVVLLLIFYYEFSRAEAFRELRKSHAKLDAYNNNLQALVQKTLDEKRQQEYLLIQQSKMAAMGEMMAAITHQWRQPIATAGMIVENLKLHERFDDHDPALIEAGLDDIVAQLKFMNETMQDFTQYFQSKGKIEPFAVTQVIDAVVKILGVQLSMQHITLEIKNSVEPVWIEGRRNELLQVLLNILSNAKDAIAARIATGDLSAHAGMITVGISKQGNEVNLCVDDNGGGISNEALKHLFEPYYTTKHKDAGTGIGLYMSKTIIEEHFRGTLGVRNIQEGARFCITLPVAPTPDASSK